MDTCVTNILVIQVKESIEADFLNQFYNTKSTSIDSDILSFVFFFVFIR